MSGSSMDGVDLAYCEFEHHSNKWSFKIECAETIPYPEVWIKRLLHLHEQPIHLYPRTDAYYGKYLGQLINNFIKKNNLQVDFISSHGHTIFHQPENGFTAQIGSGAAIYAETNLPVVSDFRTVDIALGGQGAPLVPMGDKELFSEYDACLNMGGFANISISKNEIVKAFDICPCNIILNHIANLMNLPFDDEGKIASSGNIHEGLLNDLNTIEFYKKQGAKSLGREWVNEKFWPIVNKCGKIENENLLATFNEHISTQISEKMNNFEVQNVLITGGGAFNKNLIQKIAQKVSTKLEIPDQKIINFKESLIFAFLGILRINKLDNTMSSVTFSMRNNMGGSIFGKI